MNITQEKGNYPDVAVSGSFEIRKAVKWTSWSVSEWM